MKLLRRIFIDGLSGMALGLFSTLIIGTILEQIGSFVGGDIGNTVVAIAAVAKALTGAGIGVGVASRFKETPLVCASAATAGMIGAFASKLMSGSVVIKSGVLLSGPGEPLGAFVAAYMGIELGRLLVGRTKLDIILTPMITILAGGFAGLMIGPYISDFMKQIGEMIQWGTQQQPFLMGIIVSVLMGVCLTLPISSAALGVILNLSGIAAGAATVGCCSQMIGFAVASFRENKVGGLLAQGIGTSMLQMPNIIRKPWIWIPPILTSAILGPVSTVILKMTNNAIGSGMGTAGLVGPIMAYKTMLAEGTSAGAAAAMILIMHIIAPAFLTYFISEAMRRAGIIKSGDMKLDI
ncbi:PTS transporter subunit IIC [Anaerostipes sp. 494a]|uniref:PTS transporter subunit IIC n=1 Tax=Anaerostipes sp. 494a TaxID=1261636 RepID=UPI0009FA0A7A|nr:PTS sugar transporter subunit IIC [Anaerostipes sp. 494a]